MAVTDTSAIAFCNKYVRTAADERAKDYYRAKITVNQWFAQNMSALIPNDSTAVNDGAQQPNGDGRPVITGAMVNNIITRCQDIITDFEATSNAKLNTVLQVAVNPQP